MRYSAMATSALTHARYIVEVRILVEVIAPYAHATALTTRIK
jgi:hypothetical protein